MTAEISGCNPAARFDDDHAPRYRRYRRSVNGTSNMLNRARALEMLMHRNPWLADFLRETRAEGRAEGYHEGVNDAVSHLTSREHAVTHPDVPSTLSPPSNAAPATSHSAARSAQTSSSPTPRRVWKALRETVRSLEAAPY